MLGISCSTLYEVGLRLNICGFNLWEMALNIDLDESIDNMYDWKGTRLKAGEVDITKACIRNY
jgi:hypothetical protein